MFLHMLLRLLTEYMILLRLNAQLFWIKMSAQRRVDMILIFRWLKRMLPLDVSLLPYLDRAQYMVDCHLIARHLKRQFDDDMPLLEHFFEFVNMPDVYDSIPL